MTIALKNGERQVAPDLSGIRRDHVARYEFAASMLAGKAERVIDLACGIGYGSAVLADAGLTVVALDRSAEAIAYGLAHYSRGRITFFNEDVSKLSLPAEFDAAVCFETIEHLQDPLPMLQELARKAPQLIASVPNEDAFPHGGRIKFHYRHYTKKEFETLLFAAGYDVTGWFGQAGPVSEVEPDISGRTLIAVATSRRFGRIEPPPVASLVAEMLGMESCKNSETAGVPAHVAIVGLGPSCATFFELTRRLGGVSAYCDEVWGINNLGDVLRCDRVFHMDDVAVQEKRAAARPQSYIANMLAWLKSHPGPVYTSVVREGYPGLVAYPLEDVLNRSGDQSNGGAPYFNSTAAYAIAFAIHLGVKQISLFGLDYTLANSHKAEQGRACCEFWLGIAAARGIEITIPDTSSLMDACATDRDRLYGYDGVDVHLHNQDDGRVKVTMTPRDLPSAEEIEARYDHTRHPNLLMQDGKN